MYNLKISKEQGEIEPPNFDDIKRISSSSIKNVAWNNFKSYIETFDVLSLAEENPVQDFGSSALSGVSSYVENEIQDYAISKYLGANASYTLTYQVSQGPIRP